jgi:host factor-I protein
VAKAKTKAPAQTLREVEYLKELVAAKTPVTVKLTTGEVYSGVIEYWDAGFLRLTREPKANLFIYKHDIRYLFETPAE